MLEVVRLPDATRAALFRLGTAETGLPEAIVEKDLWVCYLLDHLFHRSEFRGSMIFKGGTSLSKAFGLIERFSEDVDLILDWRLLGYGRDEPWESRSHTKQDAFARETVARTNAFLADVFAPSLRRSLSGELGFEADVAMDSADETVLFSYPRLYSSGAALNAIRLEVGPLAAWSPSRPARITPYLAELRPRLFGRPSTSIPTAVPERTFWEKATILHQEANRPEGKALPRRYARHYYDMHRLGLSDVADRAIGRPDLLEDVVAFKEKFYRTPWARLAEAAPGTMRLVPEPWRLPDLERDYEAMLPMIYGEAPPFDVLLDSISDLERRINGAADGPRQP